MSICFLTFTHSWKDLPGILSVSLTVNINEERLRPNCATGRLLILHDIQILPGSEGAGGSVCRALLSKHYVQFVILPASDRALVFSAESLSTESNLCCCRRKAVFTIICKIKKNTITIMFILLFSSRTRRTCLVLWVNTSDIHHKPIIPGLEVCWCYSVPCRQEGGWERRLSPFYLLLQLLLQGGYLQGLIG